MENQPPSDDEVVVAAKAERELRAVPSPDQLIEVALKNRKLARAVMMGQMTPLQLMRAMIRLWGPYLHNMYYEDSMCEELDFDNLEPKYGNRWAKWSEYGLEVKSRDDPRPAPYGAVDFDDTGNLDRARSERIRAMGHRQPGTRPIAKDVEKAKRPAGGPASPVSGGQRTGIQAHGSRVQEVKPPPKTGG